MRHAGELLANLGQNEQPELFAAAKSYFDNVNRDLSQIDFERLWGEGVYLEEAEAAAARRINDAMREPLNDAALAALKALLQIHGPFILATKAGLENLAFANAYEMRPDEAKEQRAAAIELAQEFKANPDVVAPETAADFAHFAEQPELTEHPERSGAFTIGMVQNIAIVITAGATIGVIIAEIGLETGNVVSGVAALPLIEGLKKSKPFLEATGLVTDGLNKLHEQKLTRSRLARFGNGLTKFLSADTRNSCLTTRRCSQARGLGKAVSLAARHPRLAEANERAAEIKSAPLRRHCERSEATQESRVTSGCFVAALIAMTAVPRAPPSIVLAEWRA